MKVETLYIARTNETTGMVETLCYVDPIEKGWVVRVVHQDRIMVPEEGESQTISNEVAMWVRRHEDALTLHRALSVGASFSKVERVSGLLAG